MTSIFVSHSSKDNDLVRPIIERLRARGYETVFVDFDHIPAGSKWELDLSRELERCRAVLFICSKNWGDSKWCFAEAVYAKLKGKVLFPLELRQGAVPSLLKDRQAIRFFQGEEAGYERLWQGLVRAGIDPKDDFAWSPSRSPYPGFLAFDAEDAAVFFGRVTCRGPAEN